MRSCEIFVHFVLISQLMHLLISVKNTKRINEGEIASYVLELCMWYEAISIMIIVLEHRLQP